MHHHFPFHHKLLTQQIQMYEYHDQYRKAAGDPDAQARWARQLTWEIARHAVGEEIVVYPLMEQHLGARGLKLTDQDRADHQTAKEDLALLETLVPGTGEYDETIERVMRHLREHNDSEEREDLPLLEPEIGEEGSREAAETFRRTKKFVPTRWVAFVLAIWKGGIVDVDSARCRTHPWAPNKPPYETLVGFLTMPIDKLKDHFAKFPTAEMKEEAKHH